MRVLRRLRCRPGPSASLTDTRIMRTLLARRASFPGLQSIVVSISSTTPSWVTRWPLAEPLQWRSEVDPRRSAATPMHRRASPRQARLRLELLKGTHAHSPARSRCRGSVAPARTPGSAPTTSGASTASDTVHAALFRRTLDGRQEQHPPDTLLLWRAERLRERRSAGAPFGMLRR